MPIVTAITRQQKNRRRFSIYLDGSFAFGCSETEFANLNLKKDDDISPSQLAQIAQSLENARARQRALAYLSRRSRSIKEMKDYLQRKELTTTQISETIDWLTEQNYLNDHEFAEQWVGFRLRTAPRGRRRLFAELAQKGIARDTAATVVDEKLPVDDETRVAYETLQQNENRFAGKERLELKKKVHNFLRYRGFSGAAIIEVSDKFLEEMLASERS